MKALCIRYYPYDMGIGLDSSYCTYLTGKTYEMIETLYHENSSWYVIENESGNMDLFSDEEFKDYFRTPAQMRRDKLQKLEDLNFLFGSNLESF